MQWFVLKCKTKKEHIAAEHIRRRAELEVFCPRVSFRRKTRRGLVRFIEALFPGYIFVKCDLKEHKRHIQAMEGVIGVVHFGPHTPNLDDALVEELRSQCPDELRELPDPQFKAGDEVLVAEGPFREFKAIFQHYLPAKQRVQVLLDFLGRSLTIEVPAHTLVKEGYEPKSQFQGP